MKAPILKSGTAFCVFLLMLFCFPVSSHGQQNIIINMAPIDGVAITPDNIFSYQVQSSRPAAVNVKGTIRYRNSNMTLSYTFKYSLKEGVNALNADMIHPQWQFSSSALQELFSNYKVLPEGTYEYCVTIVPDGPQSENGLSFDECLYHRSEDLFLINLIDPENDAKIHEYNPMLSWVANYSFASELTYRLRVSEIKQGQNPVNAVMRNQAMYDEKNLMQNSIVYPVYAKPLEANKPYAWTVDAYYKGILLGGAETWKFTIIDDSVLTKFPANRSYLDIKLENGATKLYILGEMKIKYLLEKTRKDQLTLQLVNDKKESVSISLTTLDAVYGDNRYILDLHNKCNLKHLKDYTLIIKSKNGETYNLPFKYLNPDFQR